ncbi:MAG: dienelactone hydrolase family protein [Proteobacteria bacterium]|nr:dienelactone hydrolase family protein [Pseudomonadota bacterium]
MSRFKKEKLYIDLDQDVYDLFDEYVHTSMSRRDFVSRVSIYATTGLTTAAIVDFLLPKYAEATQIDPTDSRLRSEYISYTSPKGAGTMKGLLSRPAKADSKLPGVIVVHENRGLNPHIEDVARRVGIADFIALAPDVLTPYGGYPGTDDEGKILQKKRNRAEMLEDFIAAYYHLMTHPECTGQVGVVGFCFGGGIANKMAVRLPELGAAVPFYGSAPVKEGVSMIKAPIMLHFAQFDKRINKRWPGYEAALKKNNIDYQAYMYSDVNHGFHNDTTPRYHKSSAELAWNRTIEFFNETLR